jgi:ribose-phosphate pyrophosphokinase
VDRPIVILSSSDPMTGIAKNVFHKLHELDSKFSYMEVLYKTFRNGEIKAKIPETVRHKEVYFFHSMRHPDVNTSLVKMLLTCDALKRASVAGITLVVPYMSYLRQDRKDEPRVPISVALMASLIQANKKIENIITMDLHVEQIQGLYDRLDDLYGSKIFAEYFRKTLVENFRKISLVSPDGGSMKRTDRFAEAFNILRKSVLKMGSQKHKKYWAHQYAIA